MSQQLQPDPMNTLRLSAANLHRERYRLRQLVSDYQTLWHGEPYHQLLESVRRRTQELVPESEEH